MLFLFPIFVLQYLHNLQDGWKLMKTENIYFSLDEAREEIKKRWADTELRRKVEEVWQFFIRMLDFEQKNMSKEMEKSKRSLFREKFSSFLFSKLPQ